MIRPDFTSDGPGSRCQQGLAALAGTVDQDPTVPAFLFATRECPVPYRFTHKMSDESVMDSMRTALAACLAAGICPSKSNLRLHGARGGQDRFNAAREQLAALGEIPEDALAKIKSGAIGDKTPPPGHVIWRERRRGTTESACKPKPMSGTVPRQPRYDSPVWDDIVAGEKAWKRMVDWDGLWRRRKVEQQATAGE